MPCKQCIRLQKKIKKLQRVSPPKKKVKPRPLKIQKFDLDYIISCHFC